VKPRDADGGSGPHPRPERVGNRDGRQRVEGRWEETEIMRIAVVAISLTLALTVSGCSGDGGSQASSDCSAQVRADGIVYTSAGYTEWKASRHSVADLAGCDDAGEGAAGSVFREHPQQVTTWAFRGYSPEAVVGVSFDKNSFAVFVADSVPDAERERIYRDLRRD
jgi:hypothetical protein